MKCSILGLLSVVFPARWFLPPNPCDRCHVISSVDNDYQCQTRLLLAACVVSHLLAACTVLAADEPVPASLPSTAIGGIQVSTRTLNLFLSRDVEQATDIIIAGQQLGSAESTSHVSCQLISNTDACTLQLNVEGSALWKMTGTSATPEPKSWNYQAHQQITVGLKGTEVLPAAVDRLTSAEPQEPAKPSLYERLKKQARQLQDQQVAHRIKTQLDQQVHDALDAAWNHAADQRWIPTAMVRAIVPQLRINSSATHVQTLIVTDAEATSAGLDQPCPLDTQHDLQVVLHETTVEMLARQLMGGKRVQDAQLLKHVTRMRGNAPWELWVHARRLPWSFTWLSECPVSLVFEEGEVQLVLRGGNVQIGDEYFNAPFEVSASFRPERTPSPHFRRTAEPAIHIDPVLLTEDQHERLLAHLQRKFAAILAPEIFFDGLHPPAGGSWDKFRCFELSQFAAQDGWFVVSFRQLPPALPAPTEGDG